MTEAALRQEIGHDSRVILLDEFEKNRHRQSILELVRMSSRGGTVSRGTKGHRAITFSMRVSVWVASIEVGLTQAADRNRFLVFELDKPTTQRTPVSDAEIDALRMRLYATALWAAIPAAQLADLLKTTPVPSADARLIECLSTPVAMLAVCSGWSEETARKELAAFALEFTNSASTPPTLSDEEELLTDIALARIRATETIQDGQSQSVRYVPKSVSEILSSDDADLHQQLEKFGVGVKNGCVFIACKIVTRELLKDTRWSGMEIRSILLRVEGARDARHRIAGGRPSGVLVNWNSIVTSATDDDSEVGPKGQEGVR